MTLDEYEKAVRASYIEALAWQQQRAAYRSFAPDRGARAFKARPTPDRSNAIPANLTLGARGGKLVITVELEAT